MMERLDLYDRSGQRTGKTILRGEPIPQGCYTLVVGILVEHRDGDILLMQRHPDKPSHPGQWEASASGAVLAGESAPAAAQRELQEETGILCQRLTPLYEDTSEKRLYRGFRTLVDCDKLSVVLQEGETVAFRWLSRSALETWYRQPESPVVLHDGIIRYLGFVPRT